MNAYPHETQEVDASVDAAKSRPLLAVLGERNIASITLRHVEQYIDRRYLDGVAPQTVAKELVVLAATLRSPATTSAARSARGSPSAECLSR
jgi:hypothetical protein